MIKFSKQAEKMISKLKNPEQVKKKLITMAKEREIIIGGGDVMMFLQTDRLNNSLFGGGDLDGN